MKITALSKKTKDCFTTYRYRDSDFDTWLPKIQPALDGEITVIILDSEMTFLEMAQKHFGTQDPEIIKRHALTLPMVEELVEKYSNELNTDGYGNFFFVETGSEDNPVSVGNGNRGVRGWNVGVYRLDNGHRWSAGNRLLVRNLRILEPSETLSLEQRIKAIEDTLSYHNLGRDLSAPPKGN